VGTTFAVAVASVAAPSGSVYDIQRKREAETGRQDRDQVEVRDVQAEGIGNVVVSIASAQDIEWREERLVAGAIDLRRLGVLARARC
jgi:hypothetical protein